VKIAQNGYTLFKTGSIHERNCSTRFIFEDVVVNDSENVRLYVENVIEKLMSIDLMRNGGADRGRTKDQYPPKNSSDVAFKKAII